MDAEIIKLDGTTFSFEQHGIRITDFLVSSIPIQPVYDTLEGRDGTIDRGATFGTRTIQTPFYFEAYDLMDFPLFRDFLFSLVLSKEPFYIREKRKINNQPYDFENPGGERVNPYQNQYIGGKRYKVRLQNTFSVDQIYKFGSGEFIFETTELPLAESIGTTQDIHNRGINADDALWGFGMGLIADDASLVYTHTGTSFKIYNAGNVPIHPFEQELKITIDNVQGSTSYLQLRNNTTGNAFRTIEAVSSNQTIVLDGPNVTSNGTEYYRKTNHQFITLAPGWNDFTITGANSARAAYDFRFYYK